MLTDYDVSTYTYYPASIIQDIYVHVIDFEVLTFYMRSNSNYIRVTFMYNDESTQTIDCTTSSAWVKRSIEQRDLATSAGTIIAIQFERIGSSSCTTAIDDIYLTIL